MTSPVNSTVTSTVTGPLDGITVLDLSTVGPGSRCSAMLADFGASVIKVGRADGGGITPHWWAYGAGRGTKRIAFDLQQPAGVEALLALAATVDVVLDSFRPGVVGKLGVGYDEVRSVNPRIVYAALTGYGQDGPYAQWAGHDIDYLATAGFLSTQGRDADGKPAITGATIADSAGGGMHAALAITAALLARERTGEGAYLDVSATEGVLSLMSLHIDEYLATGHEPAPGTTLLTGQFACYDTYRCSDGTFVAVGAIEPKFWANLCRELDGEVYIPMQYDPKAQATIRAALSYKFAMRTRDEWVGDLAPRDTCVAPVLTVAEVADDPHHVARGVIGQATHPESGAVRQVGPVLAGAPRQTSTIETHDTSDARELLAAAGLSPERIDELLTLGVVR